DRHQRQVGPIDHGLLGGAALVLGAGVVGVAYVGGRPGVGAGRRARGWQGGAGAVGAVAGDRVGLGEQEAARTGQREDDAAGRVKAAGERGRVGQGGRARGGQRDRGRAGGRRERRAGRADRHLLPGGVALADLDVVGVAAVDGDPHVAAGDRAGGRQG